MDQPDVLAFDVGGANIKAADGLGWTHAEPFPLWRRPVDLAVELARIASARAPRRIVATMTGEIADCFQSRTEGVVRIVEALVDAAARLQTGADVGIYLLDGAIVPPTTACDRPLAAAASNWHAMARLAAAHVVADRAVVIDVGSTTTDIVPVADGKPVPMACDDVGRMATGELVYTGVERTPVAAIIRSLPWPGAGPGRRPVASERYADARDAWLLLGGLAEEQEACDTPDGGPATRDAARVRIARMLLADPAAFSIDDARIAAGWIARCQARQVARALDRVARAIGWQPDCVVLSGHGECLARRALAHLDWSGKVVSLPDRLGAHVSRAACAHAVALIDRGMLR